MCAEIEHSHGRARGAESVWGVSQALEALGNLEGFFPRKGLGLIVAFFRGVEIPGEEDQKRAVGEIRDIAATWYSEG